MRCLTHPARVLSIQDGEAEVDVRGRRQRVILLALDGGTAGVGDWLLVQSGIALAVTDPDEARQRVRLLDSFEEGSR